MRPTIEEVRLRIRAQQTSGDESHVAVLMAALDVAEGAAEHDCCTDRYA